MIQNTTNDTKIDSLEYRGEQKSFNWKKYTETIMECHNVCTLLAKHDGYHDWTDADKGQKLHCGVKCLDLDTAFTRIMTKPALREDFAASVMFVNDYISTNKNRLA